MKRISYYRLAFSVVLLMAAAVATVAPAAAAPNPNSAIFNLRIFNDCGGSVLSTVDNYPALLSISDDANNDCTGFANLHNWRFSEDDANPASFMNGDVFRFSAAMIIDGPGQAEAGLQISPWWSPDVEGRFNVRTTDGEIACFGGVLPFYSFSNPAGHNLHYTKGQPILLEINYTPNDNTQANPAQIEYKLTYQGTFYTSGNLSFGNCNVAEEPIYGCYGVLHFAKAGGHFQPLWQAGANQEVNVSWRDIFYSATPKPVPALSSTWGRVKSIYR